MSGPGPAAAFTGPAAGRTHRQPAGPSSTSTTGEPTVPGPGRPSVATAVCLRRTRDRQPSAEVLPEAPVPSAGAGTGGAAGPLPAAASSAAVARLTSKGSLSRLGGRRTRAVTPPNQEGLSRTLMP